MCTCYPIINRVSELKVHIELTRFVQPEKIEIDANERAVNEKSQYCFFVCTTFDSFLNDCSNYFQFHLLAPRTRSIPRFQLGQFRLKFHPFCKLFFFPVNCGIHLAYKSQSGCDYFPPHIFLKLTTKNKVSASPVIPHEKIYKRYSDEIVWKCANTV